MKKAVPILLSALIGIFPLVSCAAASIAVASNQTLPNLSATLQKIMPAVVNIAAQGEIPPIANPFAQPGEKSAIRPARKFESMGSGVIIDAANGFIITNAHVLRDAQIVTVTLNDGRVFKTKVIGMDVPSDIAVVQVKAERLVAAPLGNSDNLKVGDFVAAIGNPFALNETVTSGIVSALERSGLGIEGYENFIQTDASINPGNSGGALVNLQGQVIGINTAIFSPAGGNVGIGFAIPINMAKSVMSQLIKYGAVNRGMIGIQVQDFTPALANTFHLANKAGALVSQVSPNSPAANGGIKAGDLIQSVDDQTVINATQVRNAVGLLRVGTQVSLKVLRDGKVITVSLVTADPQKYIMVNQNNNPFLFGMNLRNFNELDANLGLVNGIQVAGISESSMGWHAGLRTGDVILSANQTPVTSLEQLQKVAQQSHDELLLNVYRRDNGSEFVIIQKPQGG